MEMILILLIILVVLVGGLVFYIKSKVQDFSRAAFGTEDIIQGFKKAEDEYISTPKSIAGVTRLYLPQIVSDFPDFHYEEMRERAEHVLVAYLLSIDEHTDKLPDYVNSDLRLQLKQHLNMLETKKQTEHFKTMKIHDCQLGNYTKQKGKCRITFQASLQYYHYVKDDAGTVIKGNESVTFQTRYNIDLIYIQDRDIVENTSGDTIGLNCPNCGAPIKNLGQKFCEYCGTGVVELNINAWSFSDVREV